MICASRRGRSSAQIPSPTPFWTSRTTKFSSTCSSGSPTDVHRDETVFYWIVGIQIAVAAVIFFVVISNP